MFTDLAIAAFFFWVAQKCWRNAWYHTKALRRMGRF